MSTVLNAFPASQLSPGVHSLSSVLIPVLWSVISIARDLHRPHGHDRRHGQGWAMVSRRRETGVLEVPGDRPHVAQVQAVCEGVVLPSCQDAESRGGLIPLVLLVLWQAGDVEGLVGHGGPVVQHHNIAPGNLQKGGA